MIGNLIDIIVGKCGIYGTRVRIYLGLHAFLLGIAYILVYIFGDPNSVLVAYQRSIMPFWSYAGMFITLGIAVLYTNGKHRLTPLGRNISVIGMSVFALYTLTFLPFNIYVILLTYPLMIYAYFCEAFALE